MENSEVRNGDSSQCVRVAVNIRPLTTPELLLGCTDCISVVPGEPQVQIGSHSFTYDYVYGSMGSPCTALYDDCVAPLVDALFHGYNATVLAYGQTGSGKTYMMGTNHSGEGSKSGVIPKVMEGIFQRVELMKDSTEFFIRVAFIEIFKEEVFDLLDPNSSIFSKAEGAFLAKPSVPARVPIQIRETVHGGITLAGVTEAEVRTKEEMATYLTRGSQSRATGSTNMNIQSSRSHAIFTITMEQKKVAQCLAGVTNDDIGDDILCAKLHLVDLAGSERAKRTGADGMRFKEGIHINKGLLALGNVISALGDEKKRKGGHVPYRDNKLTRFLQDSLGGNCKTVMIACVSPADTNAEETLNTLMYANRARNIQNKAVINRDPMAAQMQRMRSQNEQLQAELLFYHGDVSAPFDELQILKHKISLLEASNAKLQWELQECKVTSEHLTQRALDAQVEKDQLAMKIELARNGKSWDEIDSSSNQDFDLVKNYVSKIQELEGELLRMKNLNSSKRSQFVECVESDDDGFRSKNALFPCTNEFSSDYDMKVIDIPDETEDEEKELEHSSLQEKLDMELKELDKKLEQKEAEMKRFASVDTLVLKQHYEKKVHELEQEKKSLQKEIEELRCNLSNISSTSDDGAQKLKEEYLQKLNVLESQNSALKKHSMRIATDGVTDLSNGGHNYDLRKLDHRSSFFLLEDMDTSESEYSDIDENDDEWVVSCSDIDIYDEDWALGRWRVRKRNSRTAGHTSVASNLSDNNDSTASGVCCSCSKYSFCKTTKCQCRASGGSCGTSCACLPTKCANRGTVLKEVGDSPESESAEGNGNGSGSDETEKSHVLASHGAMLLQSALVEKPAEENDDNGPKRKPLSDIGNKLKLKQDSVKKMSSQEFTVRKRKDC